MIDKIGSYILSKFDVAKLSDIASKNCFLRIPYKFFSQRMISYDFPRHLFLETTSYCNLKCQICPRTHGNTLLGNMDFELFKKVVDEASFYGSRTFCLHLFGEPLLAPNFSKMAKYIKEKNKSNSIVLTTNGTLMTNEIAKALIDAQVDKIAISFTSANKENYQKIAGADLLDTVEKNVLDLLELKRKNKVSKPRIYARMLLNKENEQEAEIFKNKWKNKNVIVEVRATHNYGGNVLGASFRQKKIDILKRYPCYHFWLSPAIHWNGDVSVCCNDWGRKAVLGNIRNQSLHEIWNSAKLKQYRKYQLQGNYNSPEICKNCDVWTIYGDIFFDMQKNKYF